MELMLDSNAAITRRPRSPRIRKTPKLRPLCAARGRKSSNLRAGAHDEAIDLLSALVDDSTTGLRIAETARKRDRNDRLAIAAGWPLRVSA
jgi:hypothetical protein